MLFGKHSSNDGRGRKSGEAGSSVCLGRFGNLAFSELVAGGSKVKVALGPELMELRHISFLNGLEGRPTTSNPDKKEVLGNFAGEG